MKGYMDTLDTSWKIVGKKGYIVYKGDNSKDVFVYLSATKAKHQVPLKDLDYWIDAIEATTTGNEQIVLSQF